MDSTYRKELKYIVLNTDYMKIKNKLRAYMKPDENMSNGFYKVRTLYFDTCNDDDLRNSVYGYMYKSKLRLRTYPPKLGEIKLELKEKIGLDGHKTAVYVSQDEVRDMFKSRYNFLLKRNDADSLKLFSMLKKGYMPRVISEYKRTAFVHPVSNIRVTYDYDVRASEAYFNFFKEKLPAVPALDDNVGILEVKYDSILLGAIKDILKNIDKLTEASSKYVNSRLLF